YYCSRHGSPYWYFD
nr:immunoglobulin heavy chain junction region [Mus musculus]